MVDKKINVSNPDIFSKALQTTFHAYSINRYHILRGIITSLITATLLTAATFSPLPFLSSTQAQSQTRVDVHCHLFNAKDIPLQGFIINSFNNNTLAFHFLNLLADNLVSEASDFVKENNELNQFLSTGGLDCSSVLPIPFTLGVPNIPVTKWINLLKQSRFQIACELVNKFSYSNIDLLTPAIIDYDYWLPHNERAYTTIDEQILLYEKIVRLFEGKIHPFVAFNPLKEIHYEDTHKPCYQPLKLVKEAVEERGFIGVKLYPPMGFYPINNTGRIINSSDPYYSYRQKIDDVLISLYDWCIAEDVPIMAHCANSHGSQPGYGERANPEYWRDVLLIYPELRLNLGHFGTDEEVRMANYGTGWSLEIAELMNDPAYPNVYADTGYHEVVLNNIYPMTVAKVEYIDGLDILFNNYPKVQEHLMYGSDLHALMVQLNHENYLNEFENIFDVNWPAIKDDFLGQNALRFLGLDGTNTQNRQRLLAFYVKHNMTVKPNWWIGDWWTSDIVEPSIPANLTVTNVTPCQIDLAWDASTDNVIITGYKIFRDGIAIDTTTEINYQSIGLSPATTYTYNVSAYDAGGNESGKSTSVSETTP